MQCYDKLLLTSEWLGQILFKIKRLDRLFDSLFSYQKYLWNKVSSPKKMTVINRKCSKINTHQDFFVFGPEL